MEAFIGTPEEYFGAYTFTCTYCGDYFDSYDKEAKYCECCIDEQQEDQVPMNCYNCDTELIWNNDYAMKKILKKV